MNILRLSGYVLGIYGVALLTGCGSPHMSAGSPLTMLPNPAGHGAGFAAAKEQVLYSFTGGNDGGDAATGLVLDHSGNLYGTTVIGGSLTCGTVFKLTPAASPPWTETVLFNFDCFATGKTPYGGVTFDPHGNLDGTTVSGGSGGSCGSTGCGVVFQLTPTTENVLHSFSGGADGFGPGGAVVFDTKGNLFGTTPDGGASSHGVVYEIPRNGQEKVIHAFTGGNDGGTGALGSLLYVSGSLYGVTETGGKHMWGTVYRLSPGGGGQWNLKTLYTFKGTPDAGGPYGGLIADASGKLYGTTYYGGANGLGTVFEIGRGPKGKYREHVLYSFKSGNDGNSPLGTLVFGPPDVLYGTTTMGGGTCNCGTIFKINVTTGKEAVLHAFAGGADGAYSNYGLTKGANGKFYGTTVQGGSSNKGTVFEFTP